MFAVFGRGDTALACIEVGLDVSQVAGFAERVHVCGLVAIEIAKVKVLNFGFLLTEF